MISLKLFSNREKCALSNEPKMNFIACSNLELLSLKRLNSCAIRLLSQSAQIQSGRLLPKSTLDRGICYGSAGIATIQISSLLRSHHSRILMCMNFNFSNTRGGGSSFQGFNRPAGTEPLVYLVGKHVATVTYGYVF